MIHKAQIGVFTATRAEYGLLRPVLNAMEASPRLEPQLIVAGTHLSSIHGLTVQEIEADGRAIAARIAVPLQGDDGVSIAQDMAATLAGVARAATGARLDALMILGDRSEALAAAAAASVLTLPIIHLEGGHRTAGAVDDALRHAITKLAALHFTAAEPYRRRILQLGEAPERVFTVGALAADNLKTFGRSSRAEVAQRLNIDLEPGFVLATFHPETLGAMTPRDQAAAFLSGLMAGREGRKVLLTRPNADAGAAAIRDAIKSLVDSHPGEVFAFESLGAEGYWAALTACDAVVGNSSSGVTEAPIAATPSVDVGGRQEGRLRQAGVIHCPCESQAVAEALAYALSSDFQRMVRDQPAPFGDGGVARRIVEVLEQTDFKGLSRKPFIDMDVG